MTVGRSTRKITAEHVIESQTAFGFDRLGDQRRERDERVDAAVKGRGANRRQRQRRGRWPERLVKASKVLVFVVCWSL